MGSDEFDVMLSTLVTYKRAKACQIKACHCQLNQEAVLLGIFVDFFRKHIPQNELRPRMAGQGGGVQARGRGDDSKCCRTP